jgi:hypothetical protein
MNPNAARQELTRGLGNGAESGELVRSKARPGKQYLGNDLYEHVCRCLCLMKEAEGSDRWESQKMS